jgi:hypothetical protein
MRAAMAGRLATGAVGVVMLGYGAWHLLDDQDLGRKASIGTWLLGSVIGHDGILAPVVFAGCALAWRLTGARARRGLATFLLVGGSVAIVALPSALRSGDNPNPTVTPLDYPRNLALVLGGLAVCVLLYVLGGHLNDRRRSAGAAEPEPGLAVPAELRTPPEPDTVEEPADPAPPETTATTGESAEPGRSDESPAPVDDPESLTAPGQPPGAKEPPDLAEPTQEDGIVVDRDEKLDGQG